MKQRVQELVKQVGLTMCSDARMQEFADLIVKDCLDSFNQSFDNARTTYDKEMVDYAKEKIEREIRRKFDYTG